MDQNQLARFFESRHESYRRNHAIWEKVYLAYKGGEQFKRTFLWNYEREEPEDWEGRLQRSAYENLLLDIIKRRESLLFSRKVIRSGSGSRGDVLERINGNIDRQGTSREQFVKKCFRLSQVFGYLPVLVDKNPAEAVTRQDQDDLGLYPYAVPVLPFDLLNWSADSDNRLEWALVRSRVRKSNGAYEQPLAVTEYRLIDRERIEVWHEIDEEVRRLFGLTRKSRTEYVKIDEIEHGLGTVPLVFLYDLDPEEDTPVGRASLLDPCELSIKLFNQSSWYDQLLYKTNYSTLAATPFNGSSEEPEIVVGAGDVFWVPEGGQMPEWISPDTGPAEVFERKLRDMRRRIYEQAELDAGMAEDSRIHLSGEAYGYRRKPMEDMAMRLGKNLESFERKLDVMLMKYWEKDEKFESQIVYPKRYGVRATQDALAELRAVEESNSLPPEVKNILASKIVFTEGFAELSDREQEELERRIIAFDPLELEIRRETSLAQARSGLKRSDNSNDPGKVDNYAE